MPIIFFLLVSSMEENILMHHYFCMTQDIEILFPILPFLPKEEVLST